MTVLDIFSIEFTIMHDNNSIKIVRTLHRIEIMYCVKADSLLNDNLIDIAAANPA